ncbi:MAG: response regulator [Myxococcales bacterium]
MTFGSTRARRAEPAQGARSRDLLLLWPLVALQLTLAITVAAVYAGWFASSVLLAQVGVCVAWAFVVRKQSEALASLERRTQRAEEGAVAKSALLATMSHEMRSPLNGILGMSSLLSRTSLDRRQTEQVETLQRCADNMLLLVNDVLDFARLDAGKLPIETAPFELRSVVDEVVAMNGFRAQEKRVELFAVVERCLPDCVLGDLTRTRQALANLVANAVKFTPAGEVEVRLSMPRPGRVRFSVSDTGIGIQPGARARLFTPFAQADSSITKHYGGSGLGLAISRRLVTAMSGHIDYESTPGLGSRFYFELPLNAPTTGGRGAPESLLRGKQAVIVVPHGGAREGLVEACSHLGLETRSADNLSALEQRFDLAIVDSCLPIDQLEALAHHARRGQIVVISRSTAQLPAWLHGTSAWAQDVRAPVLSWPVRQGAVANVVTSVLQVQVADDDNEALAAAARERNLGTPRVLVVEDTPVNQVVAEALLAELGISVHVARDGEEALRLLQQESFELVLMDCQLPGMSGFDTTRRLREQPGPNQTTPVIALTANAMVGDEQACREAGMDDYLSKPIERAVLIARLGRWLSTLPQELYAQTGRRISVPPEKASMITLRTPVRTADVLELEEFMRSFEEQVGASAVARVTSTFRDTVPETATALTRSVSDGVDRASVASCAHSLRGAARSMGLKALAKRLDDLERSSAEGSEDSLRGLVCEIEARVLAVCAVTSSLEALQEENREAVG